MGARLAVSFAAGFVSVITPCVLPLVPGYLSALSSVEYAQLGERGTVRRVVVSSLPFVLGFTVVFVVLGAGAAAIGSVLSGPSQTDVAGFVLIVLGLAFAFLLAGVAFARAMRAFRWLRDRYTLIQFVSGATLVALGLLLFFHRDWWLHVAVNRALEYVGLTKP